MNLSAEEIVARVEFDTNGGCWLWGSSITPRGYGMCNAGGKWRRAHRVSWEVYHGPIPEGLSVCHRCDMPACVNPDHLFVATHLENMRDRDTKGRRSPPQGEAHGGSKLRDNDVREIRRLAAVGLSRRDIATRYSMSKSAIDFILTGRRWTHVI